ncbi:hypothetical protein D9M70_511750 [compost metagenome]
MGRLTGRRLDLASALDLWRTPSNRLRESRTFDTLVTEEGWRTLFFHVRREGRQLVIDYGVGRELSVVLCSRPAAAPQLLAMTEAFGIQRVVAVLGSVPRGQFTHRWYVADHGLDLRLHETRCTAVGRHQKQDIPAFVLHLVGSCGQEHLGVSNPR